MKKFRRFFAFIALALCTSIFFTACGGNTGDNSPSGGDNPPASGGDNTGDGSLLTVTFDSLGGSEVASQRVEAGSHLTVPVNPTKENKYFDGWYVSEEADAADWNFVADRVTENTTLYAKWLDYITVTFEAHNDEQPQKTGVPEGKFATRPVTPEMDGYDFIGWFKGEENGAQRWKFDSDRVTEAVTLHAHWQLKPVAPSTELTYARRGNGYAVTGYTGDNAVVVIPATYNDLPVTAIGESAFAYSSHNDPITSVTVPDSVTTIERNAFSNRAELVTVNISENSGLTAIGNNAFAGCKALESIYIPEGLTTLGESVFNNCGSLNNITVAEDNTVYSDNGNNLIVKATNTLIRGTNGGVIPEYITAIAPRAFSRTTATELNIPVSVTNIGNYFIADSSVVTVRYAGSEKGWNAITKTNMWNYGNRGVELVFSVSVLVVYYSATGSTERVAGYIADATDGDLFELVPVNPYTSADLNWTVSGSRVNREHDDESLRDIALTSTTVDGWDGYQTVYIGYPIWWGIAAWPVNNFIKQNDFTGKTVIPFCTSTSSGLGQSGTLLAEMAGTGNWQEGHRFSSGASQSAVTEWVNGL